MKMERIARSETSALKAQTPGYYPEDTTRHSTHGESLKSSGSVFFLIDDFRSFILRNVTLVQLTLLYLIIYSGFYII